jgi:predicted nucleotidyltransferase
MGTKFPNWGVSSLEDKPEMKFKEPIENLLAQKSKIKILRFLLKTGMEFTGREIARNIKMDHKTCHRALGELSQPGVVFVNHTGSSVLYKINQKNMLVIELLIPLFKKEENLLKTIAQFLVKKIRIPILSAMLFGSIAQNHARETSDVDILIITSNKKTQKAVAAALAHLEFDFIQKFGNMLSPLIITKNELLNKLKGKDKLITTILRTGKVISGKTSEELINLGSKEHPA